MVIDFVMPRLIVRKLLAYYVRHGFIEFLQICDTKENIFFILIKTKNEIHALTMKVEHVP